MVPRALILAAIAASVATPALAANAKREGSLVGSWTLVSIESHFKDGTTDYPYGKHPIGYYVYDRTGHFGVQIMKMPPVPRFKLGDAQPMDDEVHAAYDAYLAYFGTYRVDRKRHILHQWIEGSLDPMFTNTSQPRPYRLNGDTLTIDVFDPEDGTHYVRKLHRVH